MLYVELNVVGSATPKRVSLKPVIRPRTRKTHGMSPDIGSRPTAKMFEELEILINEALEWYWDRELEKYVALDASRQRKSLPGLNVLENVLLYACCFRSLLQELPEIVSQVPSWDSRTPLSERYKQDYKRTKREIIQQLAQRR